MPRVLVLMSVLVSGRAVACGALAVAVGVEGPGLVLRLAVLVPGVGAHGRFPLGARLVCPTLPDAIHICEPANVLQQLVGCEHDVSPPREPARCAGRPFRLAGPRAG